MIKLKNLLNETTVRISTMKDVSFAGRDRLALYGKKGKVGLDKKSVSALVKAVRNVLGRSFTAHEVKEGKLTEDKFIAFYKKDRVTVNAKSLWDAKKQIIAKLKVPKKDVGLVSVLNKTEYDKQKFRFEQKLRESIREIIKEHLNEVKKQNSIDIARKVVKNKQYDKASGLDLTTANFIVQVYDSQKKNPAVQKKLAKMSVVQLSKVIGKLLR